MAKCWASREIINEINDLGFYIQRAHLCSSLVDACRQGFGSGLPKPDGKWNCSNCRYLHNASSVICEACQTPWRTA